MDSPITIDPRSPATARPVGESLVVGLVNNMPDAALEATERQFRRLLTDASRTRRVEMRLFALPEVPRGPAGRAFLADRYRSTETLGDAGLDGLIVTGAEPRSADLADEPYYPALERLIRFAQDNTLSTLWSCLAAHAAVLSLDGIVRQRYANKLSGVFECPAVAAHPLTHRFRAQRLVPHSRLNDLPEARLTAAGYQILAQGAVAGADLFVRDFGSLFIFLQGHPEYDRQALAREYRRDAGRYLARERDTYPNAPVGYFSADASARLAEFEREAVVTRDPGSFSRFPAVDECAPAEAAWRPDSMRLYSNWLSWLASHKAQRDASMGERGSAQMIASGQARAHAAVQPRLGHES